MEVHTLDSKGLKQNEKKLKSRKLDASLRLLKPNETQFVISQAAVPQDL